MKKIVIVVLLIIVAGAFIIQLIPYGRNHTNPPVVQEPPWPDPETKALAQRACYDCHSNETVWTWYSNIAPVSWLVQRDVDEGREKLNFSEWGRGEQETDDAAETVQKGEMPLWFYTALHPEANLTADEKQKLIQGLQAMGGGEGE